MKQTDSKTVAIAKPASLGAKAVAAYWRQRRANPLPNAFKQFAGTYDHTNPLTDFEGRLFGQMLATLCSPKRAVDHPQQRMTDAYLYARLCAWADQTRTPRAA